MSISSDLLSKLRSSSIESRSDTNETEYNLPDQPKKLNKAKSENGEKYYPTCVHFLKEDLSLINELQQFFFSKGKVIPKKSKTIRYALRLASSVAKENEDLFLSIYQEVENKDSQRKQKHLTN